MSPTKGRGESDKRIEQSERQSSARNGGSLTFHAATQRWPLRYLLQAPAAFIPPGLGAPASGDGNKCHHRHG